MLWLPSFCCLASGSSTLMCWRPTWLSSPSKLGRIGLYLCQAHTEMGVSLAAARWLMHGTQCSNGRGGLPVSKPHSQQPRELERSLLASCRSELLREWKSSSVGCCTAVKSKIWGAIEVLVHVVWKTTWQLFAQSQQR